MKIDKKRLITVILIYGEDGDAPMAKRLTATRKQICQGAKKNA